MKGDLARITTSNKRPAALEPKTVVWEGEIFAYWEQGMEGRIEFAFHAEGLARPIFIENGQHLTIYGENDEVVWSGCIELIKRRFWDKHNLDVPVWSYSKQKGVPYKQWMEWFWRNPSYKARLEIRK